MKRVKETAREKRLREQQERIDRRLPKHPRWDDILSVTGYVDSHGAVHAKISFTETGTETHGELFPNTPKYKTWRWWKNNGLEVSTLCSVNPDKEDIVRIRDWLYKNGCLNDWEL